MLVNHDARMFQNCKRIQQHTTIPATNVLCCIAAMQHKYFVVLRQYNILGCIAAIHDVFVVEAWWLAYIIENPHIYIIKYKKDSNYKYFHSLKKFAANDRGMQSSK